MDSAASLLLESMHGNSPSTVRGRIVRRLRAFFKCPASTLERFLVVSMLIYVMSGDFDVALHFLMSKSAAEHFSSTASFEATVKELWEVVLEDTIFATTCALELCCSQGPCRNQAEEFIMEAILVGRIMDASRRGLVMPLQAVIDEYLGMWMSRSVPDSLVSFLTRLAYHRNTRRHFGARLRQIWSLHVGDLRCLTCVDEQTARQKVLGYQQRAQGCTALV